MIGQTISHYKILEKLGEGGMGVLYRAVDTRLDRTVAIKVLRPEVVSSPERKQRFIREAKAASALNHPHIITLYEIDRDSSEGVERDFIVMEYVDGASLDELLRGEPLATEEALHYATQTAEALAAAHEAGIVHRDVKPANIMVSKKVASRMPDVKLVDFGLAKLAEPASVDDSAPTRSAELRTEEGTILGTAAYMSPEQAEGKAVDARSDVFSFGSVLYEMLTASRPFQGDSQISMRMAILGQTPRPVKSIRPDVPSELERIVLRCLEKRREARYASGAELLSDLESFRARSEARRSAVWRRPRVTIPAALALLAVLFAGAWLWVRGSRIRWARFVAIPEIARLSETEDFVPAYHLARQALEVVPEDPELSRLWSVVTFPVSIRTDPPGAELFWKDYTHPEGGWQSAGPTPLENARLPKSYLRLRMEKQGFEPLELSGYAVGEASFTLEAEGASPPDMVRVPSGQQQVAGGSVEVESFWLDKYEVTNRQFKAFVDAGGYRNRDYWKHKFAKEGREISWEDAIRELVDTTGRPGPSTWELGSYPEGQEDYPVRGVSWYEAKAFAEFAGKSLPTVYHWLRAIDSFGPPSVLELSNFDGQGPARVGAHQGLGPFGTYDMAGNVKEWCWNLSGDKRYILGGGWNEPVYMYTQLHAQSPFDRLENYGFRCAKYAGPLPEELTAPIETILRDYTREKPVDDATFRVVESVYAYDRTELDSATEPLESGSPHWRKERITFNAAYGGERVIAYLYLPTNAAPPYQAVVFFPGSGALLLPEPEDMHLSYLDFVIRSGRAVLFPVYKGTFERRLPTAPPRGSRAERDLVIQWYKDLARSVDYLETRDDTDAEKLAYYGFSLGARVGPIFTALEKRFRTSVLLAGGLDYLSNPAEVDPLNFAPRVTTPTLMLNGREDFRFPLEVLQKPLFRLLGTPEADKSHVLFRGGHMPPRTEVIKATLDWLDRYLGPVTTGG